MTTATLPELAPFAEFTLPTTHERTLANGLTVLAVRRPSVPLVEVRLRIPFARADVAVSSVMAHTFMSGAGDKSVSDLASQLQEIGGGLSAGVDADRFVVSGACLADGLPRLLGTLSEVLHEASYPDDQVGLERERLVDRIQVARQQAGHVAQTSLLKRMYGEHPYADQTPEPEAVAAVDPDVVRRLHAGRAHPDGATLTIVGDVGAEAALDAGAAALADWNGRVDQPQLDPAPALRSGPTVLVDRPGSVQSSLRIGMTALPRTHEDNAAQQLANLIYGGYFSSRLVANVRESKGYSYSPRSSIDHALAGSAVYVAADVATEVTAPALWEVWYELGRLAAAPPEAEELEQARRYALGTLRLGTATQSGLASLASSFAGWGLRPDWLLEHAAALAAVTVEDVQRVAAQIFAPSKAVTLVLGDAEHVEEQLGLLTKVDRAE